MPTVTNRYLLCRPAGGLNDMLCQIGKCAVYAERHARSLVIHTAPVEFGVGLDHYFEPLTPGIVFATPQILADLDRLAVFPPALAGQLNCYASHYSGECRNYVLTDSGEPISFDFGRDYAEPLLVHHACGGGMSSLDGLSRFRLKPNMVEKFHARIDIVGRNYAGVHVRHTDYRTDYPGFFRAIADKFPEGRLVICSDNREVVDHAKALFGPRTYSFSNLPNVGGRPLHYDNQLDKQAINSDSILDLLMLARARQLFVTQLTRGHYSGFSRLAVALRRNQALVDRLLNRA